MKTVIPIMISIIYLVSCGGESPGDLGGGNSSLEKALLENTSWPIERVGVLDIVEAGGYGDSDYPSWAVGSLVTHDDDFGIGIKIGEGVISKAKIDIDSGNEVRVWLNAPAKEYGAYTFPVTRIESL